MRIYQQQGKTLVAFCRSHHKSHFLWLWTIFAVIYILPSVVLGQDQAFLRQDIEKIAVIDIKLDPCSQCHQKTFNAWEETGHATGFRTMHKKDRAQEIAKNMGFRNIKRESLCLKCHYTPNLKSGKLKAVAGVSCESCHGAARDWEPLHYDYGVEGAGFGAKKQKETAAHREQRLKATADAGMLRPGAIYDVAANCFECHTVPHEQLVNVGGHTAGSGDFDLAANIDKVRHNFLDFFLEISGGQEDEKGALLSPERKRMLFIMGWALNVEFSLRGVAEATDGEGDYLGTMIDRVSAALDELGEIRRRVTIPEIDEIIKAAKSVKLRANNKSAVLAAAGNVQKHAKKIGKDYDGAGFAKLDKYIRGEDDEIAGEATEEVLTSNTSQGTTTPEADAGGSQANVSAPKSSIPENPYPRKGIRPVKNRTFLGPKGCLPCHKGELKWLKNNFHRNSLEPFNNNEESVLKIATNYGIRSADIKRGTSICMDCHGTIRKKNKTVKIAVSCESCHGPGKDYKRPHSSADDAYAAGKPHGMVQLEDATVRARACAECHYITDERLLASGHPDGKNFNFASGNEAIKHWEEPTLSASALSGAYQQVLSSRGSIPSVKQVDRYRAILASNTGRPANNSGGSTSSNSAASSGSSSSATVRQQRAVESFERQTTVRRDRSASRARAKLKQWSGNAEDVSLDFSEIDEDASIEEILLILKQRIEEIYKKSR